MEENRQKVITYVGAVIIVLLLIGLFVAVSSNMKNKKSLSAEKQTSEKIQSDKVMVDNELAKLKADYSALEVKSDAAAKLLDETNKKIAQNEKRISSLTSANRSLLNTRKELEDLQKVKTDLDNQLSQIKSDNDKLISQGKVLQNSIDALETEKKDLSQKLDNVMTYRSDNFLVTATRGKKKEKEVICASRTKKLNITFDVPKSLTEAISFKIVTPSGTVINSDDKSMSWRFVQDPKNFTASLSAVSGEFEDSREVVMTYSAKQKLVSGVYQIELLSNGNNIGNCRVKLR